MSYHVTKRKNLSCSTMTTNTKHSQDIVDRALHNAIHNICKFMDIKTLKTMAAVCEYWKKAVLYEKRRRYCIKQLRLPYEIGKSGLGNKLDWHLYSPLLIYDSKLEKSLSLPVEEPQSESFRDKYRSNGLEEELLEDFKKQLPNKVVVMKVSEIFTGDDAEKQSFKEQCDQKTRPGNFDILGLFLPKVEQIRVDIAPIRIKHCNPLYWQYHRLSVRSYKLSKCDFALMNRLTEKLRLNVCEYPESTILIFGRLIQPPIHHSPYTHSVIRLNNCVLELCKRAQQNGKEITLGTLMGTKMVREGNHRRNSLLGWFDHHRLSDWFFKINKSVLVGVVLRISGPNVQSWSTFIHYKSNRDVIERKLLELKHKARRKQHCTGLFFEPKCPHPGCKHVNHPCGDSQAMMSTLNRIFPGIRFIATFEGFDQYDSEDRPVSDYDDKLDENDFRIGLALNRKVSVTIISHD